MGDLRWKSGPEGAVAALSGEALGLARGAVVRHALVIFNPTAGWRRRRRLDATLRLLDEAGVTCQLAETRGRGDAEALARAAADAARPPSLVIAAGGDGTINEVANGLSAGSAPPPLAILPLGTANVLAAEIGLATTPEAVAAAILGGHRLDVPVARITHGTAGSAGGSRAFLLMAGAGFDAHVVEGVRPAVKRLLGKGAYVLETGRQMLRFSFPRYRVTIDGKAYDAASVVVARGRFYGGRHLAAPAARLDADGFQVCLFETGGRMAVLRYGAALLFGRLPRAAGYRIVPGRHVTVDGPPPLEANGGDPVQADGDIVARLPVEIDLAPRRLSLIVP
jgi:YegS/Rv2252/BmrU family lipid kinase